MTKKLTSKLVVPICLDTPYKLGFAFEHLKIMNEIFVRNLHMQLGLSKQPFIFYKKAE